MIRKHKVALVSESTAAAITNLEDMWDRVDAARQKLTERFVPVRPANSFTLNEYRERFRIPRTTAHDQIEAMLRRGELEQYQTVVSDSRGRCVMQNIFVLVSREARANSGTP